MGAFVECVGGPLDGDVMYAYQAEGVQGERYLPSQPIACCVRRCLRPLRNGLIVAVVLAGEPAADPTATLPRHIYRLINGKYLHAEIEDPAEPSAWGP